MKTLVWLISAAMGVIMTGWGGLWAFAAARDGVVSVLHIVVMLAGVALLAVAGLLDDKEDRS
jgi:hypothetical protein